MSDTRLLGKYSLENLKQALAHPWMFVGEANRLGTIANCGIHRRFSDRSGTFVMEEDWDNLVLLDACRFDVFRDAIDAFDIPGELEKRRSLGSTSGEFLRRNFDGGEFHDTILVTANPHRTWDGTPFHAYIPLFNDRGWDSDLKTVPPHVVKREAEQAHQAYPNKRLIVHFMQPHMPPIGDKREDLPVKGMFPGEHEEADKFSLRAALRHRLNDVTIEEVREAYEENLSIVLSVVEDFLGAIDGKTVISADHGEMLGERMWPIPVKGYMHFGGLRMEELIDVPWYTVDFNTRRSTEAEPPEEAPTLDSEVVQSRLEDLGYV